METSEMFTDVTVDLDGDSQCRLIDQYVQQHLSAASVSRFRFAIDEGSSYEDALFVAVLNETVIQALRLEMQKDKKLVE